MLLCLRLQSSMRVKNVIRSYPDNGCSSPRFEGASKDIKAIEVLSPQISFSRSAIREIVVIVRMVAVILFPVVLTGGSYPLLLLLVASQHGIPLVRLAVSL